MAYGENKKIIGLDSKATPIDADVVPIGDTEDADRAKKTTWTQIKAFLKTYFDTIYVKCTGAEINTGTNDTKFATPKALADSVYVPTVLPGASGNIMTSDGTKWTSTTPASSSVVCKGGATTYNVSTASGTQTIAHGLSGVPKVVRITARFNSGSYHSNSTGIFDGTTNSCIYEIFRDDSSTNTIDSSSTYSIIVADHTTISNGNQSGVITVDATNITITWTKTSTLTGNAYILWEAIL